VRVLALDLSSKTGWALLSGEKNSEQRLPTITGYGTLELPQRVKDYADSKYPWAILEAATYMGDVCWGKVKETSPDIVVIEAVNKARARFSQQYLDFLHMRLLGQLVHTDPQAKTKVFYVDSSEWRKVTGSVMDKAGKKLNAKLSAAKRKAATKGAKLDRKALGIKGKITKKHVAIARANELFRLNLRVKENDIADSLLEGLSWFWGAKPTVLE
jgi:hypothetical protein